MAGIKRPHAAAIRHAAAAATTSSDGGIAQRPLTARGTAPTTSQAPAGGGRRHDVVKALYEQLLPLSMAARRPEKAPPGWLPSQHYQKFLLADYRTVERRYLKTFQTPLDIGDEGNFARMDFAAW